MRAIATGVITPVRFSTTTGHWKSSLRGTACTATGAPIPWYTYPAIDFLAQRNFEGKNVLEFGGGQSTLWWQKRARSVTTVEEDPEWCSRLRAKIDDNVVLCHVPVDPVTRTIEPIKRLINDGAIRMFDVIIVDGHLRAELAEVAFDYLSPDGAIILDNSEGYGFYEVLRKKRCQRIDFFGFVPGVSLRQCTSIAFVRDCFLLDSDNPIPDLERDPSQS
jgi:hypothetical protein